MTRKWGASGVLNPKELRNVVKNSKLSLDDKEKIKQLIRDHISVSDLDLDAFFDELEQGLSKFFSIASVHQESSPANARKNLKKARKISLALNDDINKLDGNSHHLLEEAAEGGLEAFRHRLSRVILDLHAASSLAEEYPSRGRPHEPHRIFLAADVRDAIKKFLHVSPTSTRGGLFYSILESVCAKAFGKESPDVYELARKALSYSGKIRHADGVVEYNPPPDTV